MPAEKQAAGQRKLRLTRGVKGVLLFAPFALVPWVSSITAEHLGVRVGRDTAESADDLRPPSSPPRIMPLTGDLGIGDEAAITLHYYPPGAERGVWTAGGQHGRTGASGAAARPTGLLIRSGIILRAAQAGVQPTGTPVAPRGPRPAGLALGGVSGHGSGLRDGDVLTKIAGVRATSEGVVIAAVTRAVEAGVPAVTGEVWRRDQRMTVTAEIPVVDSDDDISDEAAVDQAAVDQAAREKQTVRPGAVRRSARQRRERPKPAPAQ